MEDEVAGWVGAGFAGMGGKKEAVGRLTGDQHSIRRSVRMEKLDEKGRRER